MNTLQRIHWILFLKQLRIEAMNSFLVKKNVKIYSIHRGVLIWVEILSFWKTRLTLTESKNKILISKILLREN